MSNGFGGTSIGSGFGCSSSASNENNTDDDNANKHDDNEEGDLFWLRECDHNKLILCTVGALALCYNNYIYKEPCMVSYNT
jgi:hypothetical protein